MSHHSSQSLLPVKWEHSSGPFIPPALQASPDIPPALQASPAFLQPFRLLSLDQNNNRAAFSWPSMPEQSQLGLCFLFLLHRIWGLWPRHHRNIDLQLLCRTTSLQRSVHTALGCKKPPQLFPIRKPWILAPSTAFLPSSKSPGSAVRVLNLLQIIPSLS